MFSQTLLKLYKINILRDRNRYFTTKFLSEHSGWHLKVSLCLERQPLQYTENEIDKLFREFSELWAFKTKNTLRIPSLSTIERKITHKLERSKESPTKSPVTDTPESKKEITQEDDLESLLSSELDLNLLPRRSRRVLDKDKTEKVSKVQSDDDLHNLKRFPKSWLFFLIKYKDSPWSLPVTDLYYGDSIRETLFRLCDEQISNTYRPYFLGYSPFTYQQLPLPTHRNSRFSSKESEIEGEKIFYYRARHISSTEIGDLVTDGVEDFAWCTFDELVSKLDRSKFHKVINSLPIFNDI
ncbi:39S ribosomal L46 family protein [Theileria parva strain Muguga]|uniref:Large ribosomal subunit protein mL46 N-terminal domain-containing protein n=1 Tax=Theileria parva TaxID=5875 RepID=Q4N1X3_THEPA|nr:39S ribosomal L46 family protein [Theileria parva strain Muguga]EAN31956.1 39S ribosomal L46 family protein [Theileria parva strain Muguga]|eukprot:XP_764239.1 hypothetical protein [Theileria parva strain Muguga]